MNKSLIILALFFSSCAFNKVCLHPDKLPKIDKLVLPQNGDTAIMYFTGTNLQPVIKDTKGEPKPMKYTIESTFIKSKSGNDIYGWLLKPAVAKTKVTILFLHGNAGNVLSQFAFVKPFIQRGFQVLLFDYSGFGFSNGRATVRNARLDANSALAWLKARPNVKNTKLIIYGQSYGGHLAPVLAAENEKQVDALVTEGAISSFKDMAAHKMGFIGRILLHQQYSAKKSIKEFHKPVLIIHSTEDETVPYSMGKKLFAEANQPKSFYEIQHPHIEGPLFYADSIAHKLNALVK